MLLEVGSRKTGHFDREFTRHFFEVFNRNQPTGSFLPSTSRPRNDNGRRHMASESHTATVTKKTEPN
jgi:hypothetical protein